MKSSGRLSVINPTVSITILRDQIIIMQQRWKKARMVAVQTKNEVLNEKTQLRR